MKATAITLTASMFEQLADQVRCGIAVVDDDLRVHYWNRWMTLHSGLAKADVVGKTLHELFPDARMSTLARRCRQTLKLRTESFLSAAVHGYVLPFRPVSFLGCTYDFMRQDVVLAPLPLGSEHANLICMTLTDATDALEAQHRVERYQADLQEQNRRDALTGCFNRRYVLEELGKCVTDKTSGQTSVILIDLDHFKQVNDTYGHQVGDEVLIQAARAMGTNIRGDDVLGRYGGEEFLVVLPGAEVDAALQVAERIRTALESLEILVEGETLRVTASLGVAQISKQLDHTIEDLVNRADAALYSSKHAGRNCVTASKRPQKRHQAS